jgi:hypothetical protein
MSLIDSSSSTQAGLYFYFFMQEGRSLPVHKAMLIALMRSNRRMAFASQEVQTITSRWQEQADKIFMNTLV